MGGKGKSVSHASGGDHAANIYKHIYKHFSVLCHCPSALLKMTSSEIRQKSKMFSQDFLLISTDSSYSQQHVYKKKIKKKYKQTKNSSILLQISKLFEQMEY